MAAKERIVFTPVKDFEAKDFRSVYLKGHTYAVKETYDDAQYAKLRAAVTEWEKQGLVLTGEAAKAALAAAQPGAASAKGTGTVK